MPIDSRGDRRSPDQRRGRLVVPLALAALLLLPLPSVSRAGTFVFPVQSEQVVTGTTTGLTDAQADDSVREGLYEGDTASDPITAPAMQTMTTGTMVGGAFPADITAEDGTFVQYREDLPPITDYYPTTQTITTGSSCGGTFPSGLQTSNNTYVCLREADTGGAALAFDAGSSASGTSSTLSWSHTTSGTNRLLVVGASWKSTTITVSSVTYGGQGLTSIGSRTFVDFRMHMFRLINPPTGANTVMVTFSASPSSGSVGGAVSFVGVDQTTPLGTFASAGGATSTPSVTVTSAAGEIVIDTVSGEATLTVGPGQTQRWNLVSSSTRGGGSTEPGAASVTMSWSLSSSVDWSIGAVPVRPAGAGTNYQISVRHDWSGIATGADAYDLCVEAIVASGAGESALVQVLTPPATWSTRITVSKTVDDNADQCYTLTATEFNAGAPSIRWIGGTESGDGTQSDVNIDHERIIRRFTNYRLDFAYEWTGVPAGVSYVLSVEGYRSDEDMNVQVLTPPATWNTRLTVNSISNTLFTYTLILSEYNGGSPQVRFLDATAADPSASDLFLDWVAITTVRLTYSLDVRQHVTGIMTGSNPILVVKGNISAGGENFHVHVWNFTSASWALLLSAPFTATNAYSNSSLAADHTSGGTVRIRFVDAASQDLTRWALSLDFVAVAITNGQAVLTNGGASPASGDITTSFAFFVRYADPENNAPAFVNLTLDGIPYLMGENNTLDTNYVDGKDYWLTRTIGIRGTFDYFFTTRASGGDTTITSTPVRQVSVLNRPPSISNPIASDGVHTGRPYLRDFNASDLDGDSMTWSLRTNASFLAVNALNGMVSGIAASAPSMYWFEVTVSDGLGGVDRRNLTLLVVNRPPQLSGSPPTSAEEGRPYSGQASATDPDGDVLSWSLETNATWLTLNPASGALSGTAVAGVYYVNVTVEDPYGGVAYQNTTIAVLPPPSLQFPTAFPTSWAVLLLGVAAFLVAFVVVARPRRRSVVEQAFFLDSAGEMRFVFSTSDAPFDEARVQSLLDRGWRSDLPQIQEPPYFLHIDERDAGYWVVVSRFSDANRVWRAAEPLFSRAEADLPPPQSAHPSAESAP